MAASTKLSLKDRASYGRRMYRLYWSYRDLAHGGARRSYWKAIRESYRGFVDRRVYKDR